MRDDTQFWADMQAWLDRFEVRVDHDPQRTRIAPGADPRASWADPDEARAYALDDDGVRVRREPRDMPRSERMHLCEVDYNGNGEIFAAAIYRKFPLSRLTSLVALGAIVRYVPVDVARWRDPAYRDAMLRRARAHAAKAGGM